MIYICQMSIIEVFIIIIDWQTYRVETYRVEIYRVEIYRVEIYRVIYYSRLQGQRYLDSFSSNSGPTSPEPSSIFYAVHNTISLINPELC